MTFRRAWSLLIRNPLIVAACVLLGVFSALAQAGAGAAMAAIAISGNGSRDALEAITTATQIVLFIVSLVISLVQMAYVTGMAGAAWRTGHATLRDGWSALSHRLAPVAGATALLVVIGVCAATLAPITFLITLIAYALFFIYTIAAVVIGERGPISGITQSASLALENLAPTLGVIAIIGAIAVAAGVLGREVGRVSPDAGWLLAGLLQQIVVAYASLVVAGEYLLLASRHEAGGS
jgi:hypothetical protein